MVFLSGSDPEYCGRKVRLGSWRESGLPSSSSRTAAPVYHVRSPSHADDAHEQQGISQSSRASHGSTREFPIDQLAVIGASRKAQHMSSVSPDPRCLDNAPINNTHIATLTSDTNLSISFSNLNLGHNSILLITHAK